TAMMSAPSWANRTACARPCPRAAPVMNATLPSTRPAIVTSFPSFVFGSAEDRRHCLPATHGGRRRQGGVAEVDLPFGEALQDLFECDPPLQPGQCRAEAVVGADAEGEMLARLAVNVENVAVRRELTVIAVGRADEHHHGAALRHHLSVIGDVAGHVARHMRSRRLEAQQFLDGL